MAIAHVHQESRKSRLEIQHIYREGNECLSHWLWKKEHRTRTRQKENEQGHVFLVLLLQYYKNIHYQNGISKYGKKAAEKQNKRKIK